jgi:hypothetical protein
MATNVQNTKNSTTWLIGKARTAAGYRRNLIHNSDRTRTGPVIGRMFFFFYDPKWKEILPKYDRFPLVFPIESYPDGFLGLNLHYLSPPERKVILNKLKEFRTNKALTEKTRLRLSYDLLNSTKGLSTLMRPCIKRYLYGHVQSSFIEITPDEWDEAINLPVAMFVYNQ